LARSFKLAGFHDIISLGDHGGYQQDEAAVAARLNREWAATDARAHAIEEYYRASETEFPRLLKSKGYREEEVGTHADLADTSLMLAIDPNLVRANRLQPGDGVRGDPTRSNPQLGQLGVDLIVTRTVDTIKRPSRGNDIRRSWCGSTLVVGSVWPYGSARCQGCVVGQGSQRYRHLALVALQTRCAPQDPPRPARHSRLPHCCARFAPVRLTPCLACRRCRTQTIYTAQPLPIGWGRRQPECRRASMCQTEDRTVSM
jgi:hypothetical protein